MKLFFLVTTTGRVAGVKFFFPVQLSGLEIEAVEKVVKHDFVRHLKVALADRVQSRPSSGRPASLVRQQILR
jgi:hypothetical protein